MLGSMSSVFYSGEDSCEIQKTGRACSPSAPRLSWADGSESHPYLVKSAFRKSLVQENCPNKNEKFVKQAGFPVSSRLGATIGT